MKTPYRCPDCGTELEELMPIGSFRDKVFDVKLGMFRCPEGCERYLISSGQPKWNLYTPEEEYSTP